MGTNYYAVRNKPTTDEPVHIGKSSYGWLFLFQSQNKPWNNPPVVWNSYDQVKAWLKQYTVDSKEYVILDEYDEVVSFDEFFELVDDKQSDEFNIENPDNYTHSRNVGGYRFTEEEFS